MTFSARVRGCIGWRFALIKPQAFAVEVVENFKIVCSKDIEIMRLAIGLVAPMVKGKIRRCPFTSLWQKIGRPRKRRTLDL
ncbi:hypothetical protein BDN71DRAFT_1419360 [Pleurotus eryngii]|uniref:Uncharacterized protein n=1 Tax=Pleurotus eryngii TaxID=5323 RepID=A0A9P5ZSG5_PLEER|nr:hypothetical protein BDN71DRAFT_1419360 [Pleurotus eryngii]